MNLAELHRKLITVARANPPAEKTPYAFEKRVMANILERPVADLWGQWAGALWRATVPCVAIMVLLAGWSLYSANSPLPANDLSQAMDNTVLAAAEPEQVVDASW